MKKIYTYFAIIALTALAAGCAKEIAGADEVIVPDQDLLGQDEITLLLNVPASPETKTTLGTKDGSSYPVYWSDGDVITLNGTAATEFTPASGNAQATAKFKVSNLAAPYNFLYNGTGTNQVSFPSTQNYVADGFDPAAMPMYASVNSLGSDVTFSHVGALLKFSFTGSKKIDTINLSAADANASLSGNFTIGATGGLLNGALTPAAGGAGLIYSFGGHIQLSDTPFVFYIAIPAGTYEGGITLDVIDNDSGHMTVTVMDSDASKTIAAGKVREFDNVTYIPNKEVNLKQIYNDATFLEFVNAVAGGQTTLNARLTQAAATLSLSASTVSAFNSIEDYKGTFDGNGKTISGLDKPMFATLKGVVKNLTLNSTINETAADEYHWGMFAKQIIPSSEVDDLPGLQNCTAQGSITWTPSSAVNSMMTLGGLVGNNKGGTISGCTNEATVTFANNGATNENQPSIGGVVGRTQKGGEGLTYQGDISNCTNNGTVVCAAQFSQNIYIGGVLGYQVEKAETMSGCVNHGLVKVASTASTGGSLQLGGVLGMGKGTIESCTNASDGIVTAEACSVGAYLCQGGVIGRINRESGTYSGLSNAGTVNAAAAGPDATFVGGVAGRCNEGASITEFTNSGSINASMEGSSGTTFIGGIVSRVTTSISNCSTTGGTLTYTGTNAESPLYIGGIVSYTNAESVIISSCTNAMTINVGGSFSPTANNFYGTGGIIGNLAKASASISDCLNTGNITWTQEIGGSNGYSYLGGVAGRTEGSIINSSNGGTVTFSGKNDAQNPYVGGLVSDTPNSADITVSGKYSSAPATNYGTVVVNTTAQSKKYVNVGGITGRLRCVLDNTTNAGKINVTSLTCTCLYLGGIVGNNTRAMSGNNNLADGDITVSGLTSKDKSYIGGVVGLNSAEVSGNNAGDVVATSGSTSALSFFIGGIVGRGESNISASTNSGAVTNACPVTGAGSYLQVGGVVGYNNGSSAISDCHNTGNVSNTANCNGYLYVGGITSESDAEISDCDNTGNVSNSGNSGNGKWISIGGIAGTNSAAMTSSHNDGAISNSGLSDEDVNIGGVAGLNNGKTITSCYNSGAVNNSGNSNDGYNVSVGGLVGWSSANSVYVTCYNEGDVENSGNGSNTGATAPGARVAGLIASASGANTISGDADNYNYNNGEVYEHSASARAAVGGVCAWANNASTSLDYAQNLSGGVIWVEDGEYTNVYVGGVLGVETAAASFNYTKNAGKIGIRNITLSKAAYIGGVHGGFTANGTQTITGCENTGVIDCPDAGGKSENMKSTSSANVVTYVGGVSSGAGNDAARTGKIFHDCINRGAITVYNQCYTRLGGVIGYANQNPSGCENHGKIVYYRKAGGYNSSSGAVGGVVGYINIATVSNLTNTGGVQSTGSSPNCYTGGIVGQEGGNMKTMENCNVGKSGINIVGAGSGSFGSTGAGLFVASGTAKEWTFTNCKVITGTKCQGTVITDSNMADAVVGRNHATSTNGLPTLVSSF